MIPQINAKMKLAKNLKILGRHGDGKLSTVKVLEIFDFLGSVVPAKAENTK